jgi:acyl carrier protein
MINRDLFFNDFKNEFIDADEIFIDQQTQFRQLSSWDSLTGMALLVMIQDKYCPNFTDDDFKKCINPGDVLNCILNYKQNDK